MRKKSTFKNGFGDFLFKLFTREERALILERLKDDFYRALINNYGFFMNQYNSEYKKHKNYMAIKEINGGSYAVIIVDDKTEAREAYEANEYLKSKGKKFSLNVVILCSNNYVECRNDERYNRFIIDILDGKVIFCDKNCKPLEEIYLDVIENTKQKKVTKKMVKTNIITYGIIAINIIIYIMTAIFSRNLFDMNPLVLLAFGAKYGPLIQNGEYYRLLTCAFLHGGIMHIACNMYSLFIIGQQINDIYGKVNYIIIYLFSAITSSLMSYIMNPNTLSIGASGAIFGLMGALLAFAIIEHKRINKNAIRGILQVLAINLFIGLTLSNIDNYGHIGGLIGGIVLGSISYLIKRKVRRI